MILSRYRQRPVTVTVPLPSSYHFQVIVTHGDTPVPNRSTPSLTVPDRSWPLLQGRWGMVRNGEGRS
jgi:hypothetical protein